MGPVSTRFVEFWLFVSWVRCYRDGNCHRVYRIDDPSISYNDNLSYQFERVNPDLTGTVSVATLDDSRPFGCGNTGPSNPNQDSTRQEVLGFQASPVPGEILLSLSASLLRLTKRHRCIMRR
jgi:hypothetical protein